MWVGVNGLLFCVLLDYFNNYYAFFVTGVNPVLILPFGFNAPMAFIALIEFPLVCAMHISRDVFSKGYLDIRAILYYCWFLCLHLSRWRAGLQS